MVDITIAHSRIQSPSSIKTYKQCPRKYYYQYILRLPTSTNIHLVRGNVVHDVLENFFNFNPIILTDSNAETVLKDAVQDLLVKYWREYDGQFSSLKLTKAQLFFYFEETLNMLFSWTNIFVSKLKSQKTDLATAFKQLIPSREVEYVSESHKVKGFIDAVENYNGEVRLMDYKTSSSFDIEDHRLQLAIYSLLYYEKHNRLPNKVGIYYLKTGEQFLEVEESLLELAKKEVSEVHEKTKTKNLEDYPQNISPLCKWTTGKCDFYKNCFG